MKKFFFYPFSVFICFLSIALTGCTDDEDSLISGSSANVSLLPENKSNDVINEKVFEVINLDYSGLEEVKSYYEAGEYYYAAYELLKYYRNRSNVVNPNINLLNPTITTSDQNIADQALEYRFYINNFAESIDDSGVATYYSFLDSDGSINWDYIPSGITDQEFAYQLHRHQWMLPQAVAYRVNKNEEYIENWIEVYGDWLDTFPCPEGTVETTEIQWYGLQPATRVIDQVDIMSYYIQSTNFTPEWLTTFLVAFAEEVECIRNNYYTDGSNIYLTQVQAVTTAGILMPEFKNASEWLNEGAEKITAQLEEQFLDDGVQFELDFSYHISAVADFYEIYQLAQENDKLSLFPSNYTTLLGKAARFVMDMIYPNYTVDNFNDTRSSSWTKSVLLRNLKTYMEMFPDDEEIAWMATEGAQGTEPSELVQLYTASGYYMLRSGWTSDATMMVLKNNYNPDNEWHCQPDNGTFGLYRNGRNFTPDAGVYSYGGTSSSNSDRTAYAATKMHNTMSRNEVSIASGYMNGEFLLHESRDNMEVLVTQNQSYSDLLHRRAVFFIDNKFFVLLDEGYGTGSTPTVNLNFALCSYSDVTIDDDSSNYIYGAHTTYSDNNNMLFKTFVETTTDYEGVSTSGYVSETLGVRSYQRRIYRVNITKPENGAARYITVMYPFASESEFENLDISAKFTDNEEGEEGTFHESGASAEVTIDGVTYELSYTL